MTNPIHNHYVTCACGAQFSDTIERCPKCKKLNPELPTLNAKSPDEKPSTNEEPIPPTERAPTLNAKDAPALNGKGGT